MSLLHFEPINHTTDELIERARIARRLLDEPVLAEAMDEAERTFVVQWLEATKPELREAAWAKVHALTEVQRVLRAIIADGEHAELRRRP
jgi:hypothetical protein